MKKRINAVQTMQYEALILAIETLLAISGLSGVELAREVGVSASAVMYWKSRDASRKRLVPKPEHCLMMALISAAFTPGCEPAKECERWLELAGHVIDRQALESFVANSGRFEIQFRRMFDEAVCILTSGGGLSPIEARIAAVARFTQLGLSQKFEAWQNSKTGFAEILVFWSSGNDSSSIRPKLRNPVIRQRIMNYFRFITQGMEGTLNQAGGVKCERRRLSLVIQDSNSEATSQFINEELRSDSLFQATGWPNVTIYAPRATVTPFEHIADCWIYNRTGRSNLLGMLVNQPDGVLETILTSPCGELSGNHGHWSFQYTLLSEFTIEKFLRNRSIHRDADGRMHFDEKVWVAH